jgi:hypothetical protein
MPSGGCLALDMNTRRVGLASGGEGDRRPFLTSIQLFGTECEDDLARSCAALYRNISDFCKLTHPAFVIYEAPFNPQDGRGNTNYNSIRGLISLAAIAMAAGQNSGARTVPANIQRWRKHFLGTAYPADPKQAALDQCAAYGWTPKNHDEADAGGVWHWGVSTHFKNAALPCSPMFAIVKAKVA